MVGQTTIGWMAYKLTLDKSQFDKGIQTTKTQLEGLGKTGDNTDIRLRKLGQDISVLGGSLATMGGLALGAGLALGNSGLGGALTTAGMGMSIVGGALATVVPAIKGMAVVIQGELIPSLIALNAFLGPTGWLIIGLGAAAAAIGVFAYKSREAKDSLADQIDIAKDNTGALTEMAEAYKEVVDAQNELAGITKSLEDRQLDLVEAKNADARAQMALNDAVKEGDQLSISEAGARKLRTGARVSEAGAALAAYPSDVAAAQARYAAGGARLSEAERVLAQPITQGAWSGGPPAGVNLLGPSAEASAALGRFPGITVGTINISVNSTKEAAEVATFVDSRITDRYGAKAGGMVPP